MQKIKILAVTPGAIDAVPEDSFAFEAVHPCGPWADPSTAPTVSGQILSGTYVEVIDTLKGLREKPEAFIFAFTRGQGMERFLAEVSALFPSVPSAGGAAFRPAADARGAVRPMAEEVAVLALGGKKWRVDSLLFHRIDEVALTVSGDDPRIFDTVESNGKTESAHAFFAEQFIRLQLKGTPWNRCGLLTAEGRLLHMAESGDAVQVSADLPASRQVHLAFFDEDYGRQQLEQSLRPESLVFGCAGLHGLISAPRTWESKHSTAYMYGEVVTLAQSAHFANLSVSVLSPR